MLLIKRYKKWQINWWIEKYKKRFMTKENFMANRCNSLPWTFFLFLLFFFFFLKGNSIYWRAWLRREQSSWVQGPPFVQGTTIRDVFDPTAIWAMSRFSATMFSNSSSLNLVNPHFLELWIFWRPGNLNLALRRASITCSLFCSLVRMDIMTWQCGPWPLCPGALQRHHAYLSGV